MPSTSPRCTSKSRYIHADARMSSASAFAPTSFTISGTRSAAKRFGGVAWVRGRAPVAIGLFLDDQGRHHAEHAMRRLCMRKNMAVECPRARVRAIHDHVPPLARGDVEGIA